MLEHLQQVLLKTLPKNGYTDPQKNGLRRLCGGVTDSGGGARADVTLLGKGLREYLFPLDGGEVGFLWSSKVREIIEAT